ncbi:MAG: DNA-directed RNA polymerase subunit H [Nanoarchaeota archaeon]
MKEKIDITTHNLVPKHRLLSKEDKEKILKKFNISNNQLPKISRKDPAIRGLDAKQYDVIKIIRNSQTANKSIYYRIVIND